MPDWPNANASPWSVFAPLLVTTLIEPAEPPPLSASHPLLTTWNSRTTSSDSSVRLDPLNSSVLSIPSIVRVLLRGRSPWKLNPLLGKMDVRAPPVGVGVARVTPGASSTNSR